MPRLNLITEKDQIPEDKRHIFEAIASSRGQVGGPFAVLLNSPEVAGRAAHLGSYIRFESILSDVDRELAIITTSREFDCDYEWSAHVRLAKQVGVRDEAISVVANHGPLTALTDDEALIIQFGRELFQNHRVCDETFVAAKAKFGDQGLTELTATMGYYGMLACALNVFQIEPPPNIQGLP